MIKSMSFHFSSFFFLVLVIDAAAAIAEEDSNALQADACVYTLNVKTGNVNNAGTDSRITVVIGDENHWTPIPDLASFGTMRPGYDYFEKGNLDFFSVKGTCMPSTVCRIIVTSDGSGNKPGWFVEYIDVIATQPNRPRRRNFFSINQWLATDTAPFQLSTRRDKCGLGAGLDQELVDAKVHAS